MRYLRYRLWHRCWKKVSFHMQPLMTPTLSNLNPKATSHEYGAFLLLSEGLVELQFQFQHERLSWMVLQASSNCGLHVSHGVQSYTPVVTLPYVEKSVSTVSPSLAGQCVYTCPAFHGTLAAECEKRERISSPALFRCLTETSMTIEGQ